MRQSGPHDPRTVQACQQLGAAFLLTDRVDEAIALLTRTVDDLERHHGAFHPTTTAVRNLLLKAYRRSDR